MIIFLTNTSVFYNPCNNILTDLGLSGFHDNLGNQQLLIISVEPNRWRGRNCSYSLPSPYSSYKL